MTDLPAMIIAATAALTPIGGAIAFVWAKVERRLKEIEAKAAACEAREEKSDGIIRRLTWEVRRDGSATRMLFLELYRLDPDNATLTHAGEMLRQQYQPDLAIPEDWADLLGRIETGTRPSPQRETM